MLLENLAELEWISIPCADKILADIICVAENNTKERIEFISSKNISSIQITKFLCKDGKLISSVRQCVGFKDCPDGEDKINCLCYIDGEVVSDSYYCRYSCQYPACICSKLFYQTFKPGCFPYGKIDDSTN